MNDFYNLFQSTRFSIVEADYAEVGSNWHAYMASFQYVRIYYVQKGEAEITLTTGRQVLREGHLYFIPSFQILSGDCAESMGHYFIHLIPDVFTDHFFSLLAFDKELSLDAATAEYLFRNVMENHAAGTTYEKIVADSSLRLILSYFFRSTSRREHADSLTEGEELTAGHDLSKFIKVFDYIDKHIDEAISLSDLAGLMFMNKVYFSNLFKKTFGVSPQQYIQQRKLDRARQLLADRTLPIASIAADLHFYDPAAFTAFFKKNTGMTPKEFRAGLYGE